jgi:hypothetical protein
MAVRSYHPADGRELNGELHHPTALISQMQIARDSLFLGLNRGDRLVEKNASPPWVLNYFSGRIVAPPEIILKIDFWPVDSIDLE